MTPTPTYTPTITVTPEAISCQSWDITNPDTTSQPYSFYLCANNEQFSANVPAETTITVCAYGSTVPVDESGLNILAISLNGAC